MLFDASHSAALRPWLVSTLEPICDADPDVLADYVLALLRHDEDEQTLRTLFAKQLDDFLEKESTGFVDKLFKHLYEANMLVGAPAPTNGASPSSSASPTSPIAPSTLPSPLSSTAPQDEGIPIPLDMLLPQAPQPPSGPRGIKRELEDADETDRRSPPKGPRLSNGSASGSGSAAQGIPRYESRANGEGRMNGYGGGGRGWRDGRDRDGRDWRGAPGGMRGRGGGRDGGMRGGFGGPRGGMREPCRDFHERGFCARGATCPFSHESDFMAPTPGPPMLPFLPFGLPGPGGPGPGEMPLPGPFPFDMMASVLAGQGMPWLPPPPPTGPAGLQMQPPMDVKAEYDPNQAQMPMPIRRASDAAMDVDDDGEGPRQFRGRGGRPYRGRGSDRGGRGRGAGGGGSEIPAGSRPLRTGPEDKTLLVDKIPPEHLSLTAVNEYFKKHGTITNIAVDARGGKAMVSFATHEEAQRAWRDPEPIFGSRFVKVLWHRPMEGKGAVGAQQLAASEKVLENLNNPGVGTLKSEPPSTPKMPSATRLPSTPATPAPGANVALAAAAKKQQLIEKHLAEQRVLLDKLSTAKSPEEKKEIMRLMRKIDEQMQAINNPPPPSVPTTPARPVAAAPTSREAKLREKLDKELEMHGAVKGIEEGGEGSMEGKTSEELLAQLQSLQAEALSMGLDESGQPLYSAPSYGRGYRGRGRGRGRGYRGSAPMFRSMKLDNRPRKLVVQGVTTSDDEAVQAVRNFYTTVGGIESFEVQPDGDIHVQFFTRTAAEAALSKGATIPPLGPLKVSWPTTTTTTSSQPAPSSAAGPSSEPVSTDVLEQMKMEEDPLDLKGLAAETHDAVVGATAVDESDPWAITADLIADEEEEERRRRAM